MTFPHSSLSWSKKAIKSLLAVVLCLMLIDQPLLALPAFAAITPASSSEAANQMAAADTPDTSVNNMFDDWDDLGWISDSVTSVKPPSSSSSTGLKAPARLKGVLSLSADDQNQLNNCIDPAKQSQCKIDVRLTDYLLNLLTPEDQGGAGFTNIQARIFQGYDTNGIGKYDRQTLAADLENPTQVSPHNSGQAVDITQVGEVTCKLVEHRLIGGSTTHWQPALPVKVAWQSPAGIANNPVPTGDSLLGVSGAMSASGIVNYLNNSGEMDAYVDYVKGLNLGQMAQYVGANVLLKNLSSAQVQFDPLVGTIIGSIGTANLLKQLPSLPTGINGEPSSDDIRISAAKAQIEDGLGLPTGSLAGLGWGNILTNTGKRIIEQNLNLSTGYLDTHNLNSLLTNNDTKAAFSYVTHSDEALNFIPGTVAALQKGDQLGLRMAAVNILAKAFKLSDDQRTQLTTAVSQNQTPNFNPSALNTGNQLSLDALNGFLSSDPDSQKKATNELKNIGLSLFRKAVSDAVPSKYTGLTTTLLNQLLDPQSTIKQVDITNQIGASALLGASNVDPSLASNFAAAAPQDRSLQTAGTIASALNDLFSLNGSSSLSAKDINNMFTNGNLDALNKLGGSEIDRAFHWNPGTGMSIITDPSKLGDAVNQTFANNIGSLLGLNGNSFSLKGNPSQSYGLNLIAQRFGLSGFAGNTSAATLLAQIGQGRFSDLFGISNLNPSKWDDPGLNTTWEQNDALLGVPAGTTKLYLQGKMDAEGYAQTAGDTNLNSLDPDSFYNQFGLAGDFVPNSNDKGAQKNDLKKITDFLKTGANNPQVIKLIQQVVGRSVDAKANFSIDDFTKFFAATTDTERTNVLLDAGLKLFGRSIGVNVSGLSDKDVDGIMSQVKGFFSRGAGIPSDQAPGALVDFFVKATGIPSQYANDAKTFLTGDYKTGLAAMSFVLWQKNINPNLPADGQLSYQEFRDTLGISDPVAIQQEATFLASQTEVGGNPVSVPLTPLLLDEARQELNKNASQNVQYKISDSFLRKIDPTIPAGFTKTMFSGSDQDRAQTLENFAFNNLDTILKKINPAYVPGTLQNLYGGKIDPSQTVLSLLGVNGSAASLDSLIAQTHVSLGPLNSTDLGGLISYFALPKSNQDLLTDTKFASTWGNLDKWLTSSIGLGNLPTGLSRSLVYAGEHGWNFDSSLKNASGQTVIPSVNSLASGFATTQLTGWADKELKLPAGTVYQFYNAVKGVATASTALHLAELKGATSAITSARAGLSQAQASLTVLAITTALQACASCQQFFSSVDAAIHAPPGFTNAAVAGAIAAAFHLGYVGLYIAAAIYLFGVNSVSYECPKPPVDQYAITSFDQGDEQLNYGYTPGMDGPAPPSSSPAPGQNPFDWDNGVPFGSSSNKTWEGWARYYTGRLLDATISYGGGVEDFDKPLQVLTYRQANVEYFAPRAAEGFGTAEANNPRVGLGFTQTTTKTTDYVYVSFGGFY